MRNLLIILFFLLIVFCSVSFGLYLGKRFSFDEATEAIVTGALVVLSGLVFINTPLFRSSGDKGHK